MNRVELIGRLVIDPEVRTLQNGNMMARFRIAVRRDKKDPDGEYKSDFINIVSFRGAANIEKYLHKGNRCAVTGRIQTGSYKNKDGQTVHTTDVIADRVEFLETKSSQQQNQQQHQNDVKYVPEQTEMDFPDWDDPFE